MHLNVCWLNFISSKVKSFVVVCLFVYFWACCSWLSFCSCSCPCSFCCCRLLVFLFRLVVLLRSFLFCLSFCSCWYFCSCYYFCWSSFPGLPVLVGLWSFCSFWSLVSLFLLVFGLFVLSGLCLLVDPFVTGLSFFFFSFFFCLRVLVGLWSFCSCWIFGSRSSCSRFCLVLLLFFLWSSCSVRSLIFLFWLVFL